MGRFDEDWWKDLIFECRLVDVRLGLSLAETQGVSKLCLGWLVSHVETHMALVTILLLLFDFGRRPKGPFGLFLARIEQDRDPLGPVEYYCFMCCYLTTMVRLVWLVWSKPRP